MDICGSKPTGEPKPTASGVNEGVPPGYSQPVRAHAGGTQQWGVLGVFQPRWWEDRVGERRSDGARVQRCDERVRAHAEGPQRLGVLGVFQPERHEDCVGEQR